MKSKNPIMKKVTVFLLYAALSAAAVLILSCAPLLESSAPVPAGTGRVVLTVSAGAAGPARTILPTEEVPVFSRYKLVFSRSGNTDIVIDNAEGLADPGVSQELAAGTWTATVTAYRKFTISGVEDEYPAAGGSADITVNAGQITNKTVYLAPLPVDATEPGIFTYTVSFPAGTTAELIFGGEAPVPLTTSGTEVSVEKAPGYYNLFISVTKGSLNAGLSEKVHIYAGLESKGVFTFTDDDFTATVGLAGTVTLPGGLTWDDMDSEAVNVVNVYSDPSRTTQIGTVPLTELSWVAGIPASNIGSPVYLGAELTGTDGKIYTGTETAAVTVAETGVRNISLTDITSPADVTGLSGTPGGGDGEVTLAWTDPADADLDHIEITFAPEVDGINQPIFVNKETETKTITGLTNGTAYTFTVKAVDTAGNGSGGETVTATPFVPVNDITNVPTTGTVGVSLPLSGTVSPANATNKTIAWSVKTDGGTDASISGNILSTTAAGTVEVTATIADGTAVGTDYIRDFNIAIAPTITVNPDAGDNAFSETDFTIAKTGNGSQSITITGSGYTNPRWFVDGDLLAETISITIAADDYSVGGHNLTLLITKSGISWSKEIRFTVTD